MGPSPIPLLGNEKADYLAKMSSHKKTTTQLTITEYHYTQPKHILRQQLDLKQQTNGIVIPRKLGDPN
jgi:hypothetical protein